MRRRPAWTLTIITVCCQGDRSAFKRLFLWSTAFKDIGVKQTSIRAQNEYNKNGEQKSQTCGLQRF